MTGVQTCALPISKAFQDDDLVAACKCVSLERLSAQLDRNANWDSELTSDEAQRLAFARILLHKPRWICVDQGLDGLSETERKKVLTIFHNELAEAAVLTFDDGDLCQGFSTRTLHLVYSPETSDNQSAGRG